MLYDVGSPRTCHHSRALASSKSARTKVLAGENLQAHPSVQYINTTLVATNLLQVHPVVSVRLDLGKQIYPDTAVLPQRNRMDILGTTEMSHTSPMVSLPLDWVQDSRRSRLGLDSALEHYRTFPIPISRDLRASHKSPQDSLRMGTPKLRAVAGNT